MAKKLEDILKEIDTKPMIDRIIEKYHAQGYTGRFPDTLRTNITRTRVQFISAYYGYFMLHGRGPGKRPPIDAIREWIHRYNLNLNEWAVQYKIGKKGTKGNDFLTPMTKELCAMIGLEIIKKVKLK